MKKCTALLLGILISMNVFCVPGHVRAEALNMWKFEFGAADTATQDGYLRVTPDMHIINRENRNYGFIGTNAKDYRLHGGRIDGFIQSEGQVIDLVAGEGGIGSRGITDKSVTHFNSGDYYPVRFALKVPDETYYKVKATVTTLDSGKGAVASLYTERKHPIFTKKEIGPGEMVTAEFTVRTTPVYYEKSDPKGLVSDNYVNVCLLGENAALATLEIEQIETAPTLWILGDSTVTDGGGSLPFFPLQNYTGVGTGVTKYLPENIAMVNEGEGGLSAHDNNHFNVVKDRIKEGDFLWVEYGHNHKSDGVAGYESVIGKYYDACKKVGATLILVGPIDRINNYDANTNTWHSSLKGFSDAAKKFVDDKLMKDPTDKVAFVDLNEPSLKWFAGITKSGVVKDQTYTNEKKLVYFYFQANRGATDVDHTHPNDSGAENLAYLFFENADGNKYPALKPLLTRYNKGLSEKPVLVDEGLINLGFPANEAWPYYVRGVKHEYPLEITDVELNENNEILSIKCKLLDKDGLISYAAGFVEISGKTYQTTIESHIDNSAANNGSVYTLSFAKDNLPHVGSEPYRVYMAGVDMADNDKKLENIKPFSKDYAPGDYSAYILATADGDIEKFDYYGYSTLTGSGDWSYGGKMEKNDLLEDKDGSYTHLTGENFSLSRALSQINGGTGTNGRYEFGVDIKKGVGGKVAFSLANGWRSAPPYIQGDSITLFEVSDQSVMLKGEKVGQVSEEEWTRVSCVLDMDEGRLTVKVNGNEKSCILDAYCTYGSPEIQSMFRFVISGDGRVDVKLKELFGAKCNLYDKKKNTIAVTIEGKDYGNVLIDGEATDKKEVNAGKWVKLTAEANENGRFIGWYHGDEEYSLLESVDVRLYESLNLTARFLEQTPKTSVTIKLADMLGRTLKAQTVTTDINGRELHEEMKYTIPEEFKAPIIIESGDYKELYLFKYAEKDTIASLLPDGENQIKLVFDYDGSYVLYESFDNLEDTWGFDKEAKAGDGVLYLLTGVGTANRTSSVKVMDESIKSMKKLTIRFEWKSDVDTAKGRNSSFDLIGNDGQSIFSIRAKGKDGIGYAIAGMSEIPISNNYEGVNDKYTITVSADFEKGVTWGCIENNRTGRVVEFNETSMNAKCLEKVSATYGYSSAGQQLYSFAIRDDSVVGNAFVTEKNGTTVTVKVKGKRTGNHLLVTGVYQNNKLVHTVAKTVKLAKDEESEITFDTVQEGDVKVFFN